MREQRGGILLRVANETLVFIQTMLLQPGFRERSDHLRSERGCASEKRESNDEVNSERSQTIHPTIRCFVNSLIHSSYEANCSGSSTLSYCPNS
jgi:hypothetical protein